MIYVKQLLYLFNIDAMVLQINFIMIYLKQGKVKEDGEYSIKIE